MKLKQLSHHSTQNSFYLVIYLFIYFEKERHGERDGMTVQAGEKQREGKSIPGRLCTVNVEPDAECKTMKCKKMT